MSERDRERADYEAMFRRHYAAVWKYALRRAPGDVAGDAVAETFLVAWRQFEQPRRDELAWLLGIARRVIANQWRSQRRRDALEERLRRDAAVERPLAAVADTDPRLADALGGLSELDREVLLLVAWDGLDPRTAARVAGCSPATFRVRLHRARRRLLRKLSAGQTRVSPELAARGGSMRETP